MMYIRECLNGEDFYCTWNSNSVNFKESFNIETKIPISTKSLMVEIEGIHQFPTSTRNYTRYKDKALLNSINTWTKPYERPMILHHNEKDGKIIGRILSAEYKKTDTLSKTPALYFLVNISDKEGIEGVKDGRLKTVSIGVIVNDCRCSICNQNIAEEGQCEHERGIEYDGQICYWDIYDMEAKELSYVIVPSDIYAQNIKFYDVSTNNNKNIKESYLKGAILMDDKTKIDQGINNNDPTDEQKKIEKLEEKVKKLEAELKDEKEKVSKAIDNLDTANKTVTKLEKELTDAKNNLVLKDSDILKEKKLRETLEEELSQKNISIRESLEDKFISLRESLGKTAIDKNEITKRSDESLNDAIKDLKEELSKKSKINNIEKIQSQSLVDDDKTNTKTNIDIKETSSVLQKDILQEQMHNLMYSLMKKNI